MVFFFRKYFNGTLLRCMNAGQVERIVKQLHDGPDGGHFSARTTAMKIMRVVYYWPSLFHDCQKYVRRCEKYAFFFGKQRLAALPLHPIQVDQPFSLWGLDFIGPINPLSSSSHKWILVTTNYFTRWTEEIALKDSIESSILEFLDGIVTRFSAPSTIILDNAKSFVGAQICACAIDHGIYLTTYSNYYHQDNGLAESSNKNLIRIIKRTVEDNQRCWNQKLKTFL